MRACHQESHTKDIHTAIDEVIDMRLVDELIVYTKFSRKRPCPEFTPSCVT